MSRKVWKRREEPVIAVRARLLGSYEFVCPDCGKLCVISYPNWRTGRVRCTRRKRCGHGFQAGVLLADRPFARFVCRVRNEVFDPRVANAREPLEGTWLDVPGHILGPVEWWCPTCGLQSQDTPLWEDGLLACPQGHLWYCGLLISRPESGFNAITPYDWIPPYDGVPPPPPLPPHREPGPGADCDGAGDPGLPAAETASGLDGNGQ